MNAKTSTDPQRTRHFRRAWELATALLVLGAMFAVAALYFIAGPLYFLGGLVALVPLCMVLSSVESWVFDRTLPWR